ncbi:MAG: potassium-transporting ATPase subunit B, partial [Bryobacteraceae bacterium]
MPTYTATQADTDSVTTLFPMKRAKARPLFDKDILSRAAQDAVRKLNPVTLAKNPVILVVEVGAILTTILVLRDFSVDTTDVGFALQITIWL